MKQYQDLLQRVLDEGTLQDNRTGIPTLTIDGAMLQFNMKDGFPAVTTKKLAFNAVKGELIGFIHGADNAADFRALGCNVWNQNANENQVWLDNWYRKGEDDLGRIYGAQWRSWRNNAGGEIDQFKNAINEVINAPTNRRIIVNAWNPAELDQMALPPCHMLFQLLVNVKKKELSLLMYMRSCDMFLGVPFNIASYALLLHVLAKATGYNPGRLTMFLADCHIYENHIEQVKEQLTREPFPLPTLVLPEVPVPIVNAQSTKALRAMDYIEALSPSDIQLVNYLHHPAITAPMAV